MISIILPIRNEVAFIEKTLNSILYQNPIGQGIEILIADGMSDDGTREYIEGYIQNNGNTHLIDNPEQIVSTGFNRALSVAKGDIIIRVDGHSEIDTDFINNCLKQFENTEADCVGGATAHMAKGIIGKVISIAQSLKFGVGGIPFREGVDKGRFVDTLAFGAYKRDVFEKIGGYDEELVRNQDDEFNFRMIQNGGKIWLDPSIKSTYYPRNSFLKLFKQYFQYGFYKIRVFQKRGGFASWKHLVPGIFVLSSLVGIFLFFIKTSSLLLTLIGVPYLLLSLIFTFLELFKSPKHVFSVILLPLTFFILHFSYGLGFLLGILYFWNKWNDREVKDHHFDKEQFKLTTYA